jgi:hypothetical protein
VTEWIPWRFAAGPVHLAEPKRSPRDILIDYLRMKVEECDWHAVADAANDLRVLEAQTPPGATHP